MLNTGGVLFSQMVTQIGGGLIFSGDLKWAWGVLILEGGLILGDVIL